MKIKYFFITIMVVILSGCVYSGYYYGVDPIDEIFDDDAFVLLAVVGKYNVNVINGKTGDGKNYSVVIHAVDREEPISDVYALHFKAGDSLAIDSIQFQPLKGSTVTNRKFMKVSFDNPKLMHFPEPKIYYYGMVISTDKQARLVSGNREKVLKVAKRRYPTIFAKYPIADQ
ncbi:MAG: hypothetical protein ACC657_14810 [Thiohalomonadales bacterium]